MNKTFKSKLTPEQELQFLTRLFNQKPGIFKKEIHADGKVTYHYLHYHVELEEMPKIISTSQKNNFFKRLARRIKKLLR